MRRAGHSRTGRSSRLLKSDRGRFRVGWRLAAFLAVTVLVALAALAVGPGGLTGGSGALLAGSLGAGWLLLASEGRGPGALGFHLTRESVGESLGGLGLGVSIGGMVVGLMAVFGGLRWTPASGDVVDWLTGAVGALAFLALPAAAEEAFLRGYPMQALAEVWGAGRAIIATSVVFGVMHLGNPGISALSMTNIVVAGLLLGVVYVRTASLWWATGAHLGWNWALGFMADAPVSGLEVLDAPLYDGAAAGPGWLGGGSFGPEGSVVATLVLGVATVALWRGPWLRPGVAMSLHPPLYGVARVTNGSEKSAAQNT